MPTIIPVLALLVAAPDAADVAPLADRAGNRIEPLVSASARRERAAKDDDETGWRTGCTRDGRWCVELVDAAGAGAPVLRLRSPAAGADLTVPIVADKDSWEASSYRLWMQAIRTSDGDLIVGVEGNSMTGYSGGGAEGTWRRLFRVSPGRRIGRSVLTVPIAGWMLIRACFSEKDMAQRADACHDEYRFSGDLALDPATTAGPPRLLYRARAKSFPGNVSRDEDSLAKRPLRKRDLVWVTNNRCTYRRVFRARADGQYAPDRALPDCTDYTAP